ncbi:uncharacterized protein LOC117778350 [Hippoglossus hippoglossus]|uniref:uncharacterized protein LOC117778350 n=1 Tax=Hippoglossus hippoglossus TaxID=8267 RepID=UPI00148D6616|nr:uncharacterized protein LOC117778350 [Hippoglossus hippoglossus]
MANEGAWKRLNPALRCGQTKMKFKAMGPGAADLQLNIGNEHPLPLTQLPESCGHSLQQSTLGLVLVAPYDGCNVIQENGNYVVSMTWLEAEVKLTCPILQSPDATPAQHPWKRPVPHRPSSFYHPKRHVTRQTGKWREATMGVREGTIVFGRGAESHVANGNRKAPSNASAVEDERAYQADSAGLLNGQAQDTSPKEASWKRMAPSLQCGGDQMKFRAVGPGASQFAVDQGNAHPMPLSQVPSTCGYTMQRNSLALVMLVPYDGCNMVQEGGSYMLPMLWQGIPVSLWCNKPPATTSAQPQDPVPMVQFPGYPPFYPWYLPGPLPTPAETTTTTQKMTTKPTTTQSQFPQLPKFPPYGPFQPFPHYHWPLPTPAETTTTQKMMTKPTTTQSQFPQVPQLPKFPPYGPQFPPYGPFQPFPHYHWPLPGPLPTPAETTTTQKMTTKPTTTQSQFPQLVFMDDYDVDMDEEEEGDLFMRKATAGHWWEDCGGDGNCDIHHQRGGRGCMVNSRSWAEELQDIFTPQAVDCYSGGRSRISSISDKVVSEASAVEIRTGSILFNGKELNSESGSPSAAATNDDGLPHVVTDQPEGSETSQLNEVMANEGAWRRLNPTLHCGQTKMKFKAMGPGAADLQLDIGNEHPLPLTQLPESCGHSLQQSTLGLVLVAPYDGCNVIQENGNYVVSMTWLEAEVKLTCPILQSPDATPAQHSWKRPVPHRPSSFYRPKRHVTHPISIYDSLSAYLYWYYSYLNQDQAMAPTTTTAEPDTTTTSKPTTEEPQNPPVYPPYMYYPYWYSPYYYYYPLPESTAATPAPAATAPATNYPIYYPYHPPGQHLPIVPDNADIYYHPIIQHIYGSHPYHSHPMQTTTQPPTSTTNPSGTTKPSGTSPTAAPTTASTTKTTKPCSKPTTSSGSYPGQLNPFVRYDESPFAPVISYAYNKAGKLPDYQKYMPQNSYKSGPQARAHSGFDWRAVPWLFPSTGRGIPQIDWENLQLK